MKNYLRMFFTRGVACAALLMHVTQLSICDDNVTETADGKVTLVADGYQFTEGPAVDSEGVVFFTLAARIVRHFLLPHPIRSTAFASKIAA